MFHLCHLWKYTLMEYCVKTTWKNIFWSNVRFEFVYKRLTESYYKSYKPSGWGLGHFILLSSLYSLVGIFFLVFAWLHTAFNYFIANHCYSYCYHLLAPCASCLLHIKIDQIKKWKPKPTAKIRAAKISWWVLMISSYISAPLRCIF